MSVFPFRSCAFFFPTNISSSIVHFLRRGNIGFPAWNFTIDRLGIRTARWISMRPWNSKNASVRDAFCSLPLNFLVIFQARSRVPLAGQRQNFEFEPRMRSINSFFQSNDVQLVSRRTFCFSNNLFPPPSLSLRVGQPFNFVTEIIIISAVCNSLWHRND